MRAPVLVHEVKPVYPAIAKATRTSGTVSIEAVIARDGSIKSLRAVSGSPFLVKAAIEAVSQWRYQPATLNGAAVDVNLTIEVTFRLQ